MRLASLGKGLGTAAVLWDGERGFRFPLGILGRPRASARSGA